MISFVVPAYNEERLVGRTLEALHDAARAVAEPYELIVVDDGSIDETATISMAGFYVDQPGSDVHLLTIRFLTGFSGLVTSTVAPVFLKFKR